jgi:hypothetical protein
MMGTILYSDTAAFTLENDFFGSREDNHYTNGASLIWMQEIEQNGKYDFILDGLQTNTALSLIHQIFTPTDKEATEPVWDDIPYAGYAKFNFLLYKSTSNYFHEFGISMGAVGPITHAEQLQDFFHKVIGDTRFKGWDNQLENQFMAGVSYQFAYKTDPWDWYGYKIDSISNIRGDLGNFYSGILVSTTLRLSSFVQKTFMTTGSFMVTDESDLLNVGDTDGLEWDLSFGIFGNLIHNYYIVDEGIDEGYDLDPMRSTYGWQAAVNIMYGSFKCTYKLKSAYVNDQRDKRYGGLTLIWQF